MARTREITSTSIPNKPTFHDKLRRKERINTEERTLFEENFNASALSSLSETFVVREFQRWIPRRNTRNKLSGILNSAHSATMEDSERLHYHQCISFEMTDDVEKLTS